MASSSSTPTLFLISKAGPYRRTNTNTDHENFMIYRLSTKHTNAEIFCSKGLSGYPDEILTIRVRVR